MGKLQKLFFFSLKIGLCTIVLGCSQGFDSLNLSKETQNSTAPGNSPESPNSNVDPSEPEVNERPIAVDQSNPMLIRASIAAQELDPNATTWIEDHLAALDTRVTPKGILVLYLIGAGDGTPTRSTRTLDQLSSYGFHVIAPDYAQDYGITAECNGNPDCTGLKRLEAFEGVDHSGIIQISRSNSIEERLTLMIAALTESQPEGDWGYFMGSDNEPRWDRIYVAGISHGASTAALIGKVRKVARVVSVSGPLDVSGGTPSTWLSMASMTPIDRYYTFSHQQDGQYPGHTVAWSALGILGEPTIVDGAQPPYGNSHRLYTNTPSGNPHSNIRFDTRNSPERTALEPAWRHLLGVN